MMSPVWRPAASAGLPATIADSPVSVVGEIQAPVVDRELVVIGDVAIDRRVDDAQPWPCERLVVHGLVHDRLGDIDRYREEDALRACA